MSIHLPARAAPFPRPEPRPVPANAWATYWKHLRAGPRLLVRRTMRDGLHWLRG
ncbi:hypothetical protein [Novosphingobium huizhouense]|uniref:hypothetical protein n=1 Tax=Novosphingobium huizhouense TaxID=2866625 RepID=UPI001CD8FEA4|nr:hypothetical protein [Novosphingobium huizhouense]